MSNDTYKFRRRQLKLTTTKTLEKFSIAAQNATNLTLLRGGEKGICNCRHPVILSVVDHGNKHENPELLEDTL